MKISVRVTARAKQNKVELQADGSYQVRVTAAPTDGKANDAVIALLADFFHCARSHVQLKTGATARKKIFEIM